MINERSRPSGRWVSRCRLWGVAIGLACGSVGCGPRQEPAAGARPAQPTGHAGQQDRESDATALGTPANPSPDPGRPAIVPGLEEKPLIAPLKDAYERMDPTRDGWETEAFSAAATAQLQALKSLLTASAEITAEPLAALAVADVRIAPLRPGDTSEVFRDGRWLVRRAKEPGAPQAGLDRLAAALNDLRRGATQVDPLLKVFRVSRIDATEVETAVVVSIGIYSATDRRQINAEWTCRWRTPSGTPPLLAAITPASHEEVIHDSPQPLFADATAALLADSTAYRDQWLVSSDHWRARLPRDLGLDPVANHGLAIGDVNGDHLDDLYVCQQGGLPNRLYLQRPDGTLEDVTSVSGADWLDYCAAALFVDLDNDGDRDLVISQDFRVLFMANEGSGRFSLETVVATKAQSFSLAAADYDRDGLVDVYVCGYNPSTAALRGGAMGEPLPFHDANNGGENILWRNEGGFRFEDVTAAAGLNVNNTRYSFAAAWEDYDNDGDQDLYVANDYGRNNLYRNEGERFTDVAGALGVEDTASGMSVSWSDFNHDGLMDLYVSNMFSSAGNRITYQKQFKAGLPEDVRASFQHIALGNTLFQGVEGAKFKDVSVEAGVTLGRWAWCSKFADFNNDGLDDILVANGFITTEDTGDL